MQEHKTKTDEELIDTYRNKEDLNSVGELFRRYKQLVFGLCLNYFKDTSVSQDAVLDIFEKLIRKLKTHEVEHFKSWLFTLSKNHCLEQLRKSSNRFLKESEAKNMYYEQLLHPDDSMRKEELLEKLIECMEALPEKQKQCIQMFYLEKKSYQELSDHLKLSWNKVRSFIQNGRRNLKICMEV